MNFLNRKNNLVVSLRINSQILNEIQFLTSTQTKKFGIIPEVAHVAIYVKIDFYFLSID
jgi:hypothetical protein